MVAAEGCEPGGAQQADNLWVVHGQPVAAYSLLDMHACMPAWGGTAGKRTGTAAAIIISTPRRSIAPLLNLLTASCQAQRVVVARHAQGVNKERVSY